MIARLLRAIELQQYKDATMSLKAQLPGGTTNPVKAFFVIETRRIDFLFEF